MAKRKADSNGDVAYDILRSIRRILRKTSQHSRQIARQSGLSVPQLLCLKAIDEAEKDGEVTAAMIAEIVQLSPPTATLIVDRLEVAGYVSRERRSQDRRKVCLSLTELGQQRLKTLPRPLHDQFLERLKKLKAAERSTLLRSLEQIVEMIGSGRYGRCAAVNAGARREAAGVTVLWPVAPILHRLSIPLETPRLCRGTGRV